MSAHRPEPSPNKLHQDAVELGSKGGRRGGAARARVLSPAQRRKIAAQGGRAKARKPIP